MHIFVTGATGFIGTELIKELTEAGHQVRGFARSDSSAAQLQAAGVGVQRGTLEDLDSLRAGAAGMDAVVHLAFNHDDMSKFAESGAAERTAIEAMASVMAPGTLLVVTSGVLLMQAQPGQPSRESDTRPISANLPRQPEDVARSAAADRELRVAIVRLPQVHDTHKQGLVPYLTALAREKGVSAYVGDGANRWAAAPRADVAHLYRLVIEQTGPGVTVYHAVQEEGVPLREIAETIGKGLSVPVVSLTPEQAAGHFTWLALFAAFDGPSSSEWTRKTLDWNPTGPSLIEDLSNMNYN